MLDRVSFLAQGGHLGPGGSILGTLGDRLGDPGILGDTRGHLGVQTWILSDFRWILGPSWDPLWSHFGDF